MNYKKIAFYFITIVLILSISYYSLYFYIQYQEKNLREEAMRANILNGIEAEPVQVEVDYDKVMGSGSPLVFGGSHTPPFEQLAAWKDLEEVGLTMIRKDLYVEFTLPRNITIEDYQKNRNNVQDPATWDQKTISNVKAVLKKAKENNIKVMGIMAYAPKWLTHNGTAFGVPKDWNVYRDIVKKIYSLYRDELDYIEIWNEPDHKNFLVTEKSNLSKEQAYANIYISASNAIREVDNEMSDGKSVKIGAPVESNPRVSKVATYLMNEADINIQPDFLSFHTYDTFTESFEKYKQVFKPLGDIPIFITEWNYVSQKGNDQEYKTGSKALVYTASQLIDYLNSGIDGANYFAILPIDYNNRGTTEKTMGFYKWVNGKVDFLPQARSWRLMSKSLGLGKGKSQIIEVEQDNFANSLGFVNSDKENGVVVINESDSYEFVEFQFINIRGMKRAQAEVYIASESFDGGSPGITRVIYPEEDGSIIFRYQVPAHSVFGVKLSEVKEWYDVFDPILIDSQ